MEERLVGKEGGGEPKILQQARMAQGNPQGSILGGA